MRQKGSKKSHLNGELTSPEQSIVRAIKYIGPDIIVPGSSTPLLKKNCTFKIDGHSRSLAWQMDRLEKPEFVTVMIFECSNLAEIESLYKSYNNKEVAETPAEEAYHAKKLFSFEPTTKLCKSSWKAALTVLGHKEYSSGLNFYLPAMRIVDSWGIQESKSYRYSTGFKAAILKTLTDSPDRAQEFWALYNDPESNVAEINRLRSIQDQHRGVSSAATVGITYSASLGAFESWCARNHS